MWRQTWYILDFQSTIFSRPYEHSYHVTIKYGSWEDDFWNFSKSENIIGLAAILNFCMKQNHIKCWEPPKKNFCHFWFQFFSWFVKRDYNVISKDTNEDDMGCILNEKQKWPHCWNNSKIQSCNFRNRGKVNTLIHDHTLVRLGTATSITSG